MKDYHINVFWSDEDRSYIADIPDLFPCSAAGNTPEEALAQVLVVKQEWLAAAHRNSLPIPEPSYHPEPARAAST